MEEQSNKPLDKEDIADRTPDHANQAHKLQEYMNQAKENSEQSYVRPGAKEIMAIFEEIESHDNETSAGAAPLLEEELTTVNVNHNGLDELHQKILSMKPKETVSYEEIEENVGIDPDEHQDTIKIMCQSKAEEFVMLGYEYVTIDEIWQCVSSKYKKGTPALHQVVNDILSLKATQFMNWMTMSSVYMRK